LEENERIEGRPLVTSMEFRPKNIPLAEFSYFAALPFFDRLENSSIFS